MDVCMYALTARSTCEPVSTQLSLAEVWLFQKRMQRSAVPPPEARMPCW